MARTRFRFHPLVVTVAGALPLLINGCGIQLETDYKPRLLNATESERRAYYAPAFSPAKSAQDEQKKENGPSIGAQP